MYSNVFCEDSIEFLEIRISCLNRFYLRKVSLLIDNLSLHIFFRCNLLILGYWPGIEQNVNRQ